MKKLIILAVALLAGCSQGGVTPQKMVIATVLCEQYGGVRVVRGHFTHAGYVECNDGMVFKWARRKVAD